MGAPKQKWTEEEEAALKAGVIKHGAGKWRTILKDPEFNSILFLRSNVDLKDKWRNLSAIANGWGPRDKSRVAMRRSHHVVKHDDDPMALSTVVKDLDHDDILDVEPIATSSYHLQITGPKQSIPRLDDLIFEAITSLKEPNGSDKISIVMYIEDQYDTSLNLEQLSAKLKTLTASRRLVRVNRKYRMAPTLAFERRSSRSALERQRHRLDKDDLKPFKSQIDAELAQMRKMTAEEAASVAAQAVAEAEAAMEEAEEAMRDAEAAEADAKEARSFAKAAILTLKRRNDAKLME